MQEPILFEKDNQITLQYSSEDPTQFFGNAPGQYTQDTFSQQTNNVCSNGLYDEVISGTK